MDLSKAQTFVLVLGHAQSGHSFVASILDSHPNVMIGNEVKATEPLETIVSRRQWQSRFTVPNQPNKRVLRIIGSKSQTGEYPATDLPVKFILVVRNPFDNIASNTQRGITLAKAIENYEAHCLIVEDILNHHDIFIAYLENLCQSPRLHLGEICSYLGISLETPWINDCASVIELEPETANINWPPETLKRQVAQLIDRHDWLAQYGK